MTAQKATAIKPDLPKVLTSVKELPAGGRLIDPELPPLNLPGDARKQMAVWLVSLEDQRGNGKPLVWMIGTEELHSSIMLHQHKQVIRAAYTIEHVVKTSEQLLQAIYEQREVRSDDRDITKDNEVISYYEKMVGYALRERVSDIHIEKRARGAVIRMRKHGQLRPWREMSASFAERLASVIHNVLAENKDITFMPDEYQAAAVSARISGLDVKLRFQSLPVYPGGFDVILRVLPLGTDDEKIQSLEELGYARGQMDDLLDIVAKPVGALIIAGTTGSGKSTTLKNLLMFVNAQRAYRCKIYTIEDPPEYRIPRTSQIPVVRRKQDEDKAEKVSPFLKPLVATMRADPDILMIGEIRDAWTGDGMKKANQSGHQVLTTVHAQSALGIISRLVDFGIPPNVLGSPEFINGLIYQKLVPTLCKHCAIALRSILDKGEASEDVLALAHRLQSVLKNDLQTVFLRGPGCKSCDNMGVSGRTVCSEIIAPDFKMLRFFREGKDIEAYHYWRSLSDNDLASENMKGKTVLEHALIKIQAGQVSPEDVEDLLGPVDGASRALQQLLNDVGPEGGGEGGGEVDVGGGRAWAASV